MKWRVIIRMSFDGDKGSKLRYQIEKRLNECGIAFAQSTGTWEGAAVDAVAAATQLRKVMAHLAKHVQATQGLCFQSELDHLWVYIDRART